MRRSRRRDLAARRAVLVDERLKPFEAVRAGGRRVDVGVDVGEAAQPALDLGVAGELVTDLGGQLRDLVGDMGANPACGPLPGHGDA